jgi:hypothetical protein
METLIKAQRKYNPHSKIRNFELGIHSLEQGRGSWTEPSIFDYRSKDVKSFKLYLLLTALRK